MALPVSPGAYLYSHFRHVSGVPAPEGVQGVAISKLKILDILIEQLTQIKKNPDVSFSREGMPDGQIDALIEQYENQIRQAKAASVAMPYVQAPAAPTGMVLNLTA
jgi:hypothetical protein